MFSHPVSNTKVPDLQVINSSTHLILTEKNRPNIINTEIADKT